MPHHHSKQSQLPPRPVSDHLAYAPPVGPGHLGHLHSQHSFPPTDGRRGFRNAAMISASLSMPPGQVRRGSLVGSMQHQWRQHPSHSTDTTDSSGRPYMHGSFHRSTPVSQGLRKLEQTRSGEAISSSNDENDTAKDSTVAASVMLLAVAAGKEGGHPPHEPAKANTPSMTKVASSTSNVPINRPLKKRKTVIDIIRKKPEAEQDLCHVSPMSHGSKSTAETVASSTHETIASSDDTLGSSRALSYESKEHDAITAIKTLTENRGTDLSQALMPHFPSALYWLLTESSVQTDVPEYAEASKILQWLPHGQAWKILRWDALRCKVLPYFFPQLSTSKDSRAVTGSIDSFLFHLKSWGFEEIKDGPDVGAFAHSFFRRGHPQLCEQMKFTPDTKINSILRVPSLSSPSGSGDSRHLPMMAQVVTTQETEDETELQDRRESNASSISSTMPQRHSLAPGGGGKHSWKNNASANMRGPPIFVNYRPEERNLAAEAWHRSPQNKLPSQWMGGHPMTPPDQRSAQTNGMPPYSPIRIRSGRGARRMPTTTSNNSAMIRSTGSHESSSMSSLPPTTSTATTATTSAARGFPVSNRGKGRRTVGGSYHHSAAASTKIGMANELTMLSNVVGSQKTTVPSAVKVSVEKKSVSMERPRSVMKRKLPFGGLVAK